MNFKDFMLISCDCPINADNSWVYVSLPTLGSCSEFCQLNRKGIVVVKGHNDIKDGFIGISKNLRKHCNIKKRETVFLNNVECLCCEKDANVVMLESMCALQGIIFDWLELSNRMQSILIDTRAICRQFVPIDVYGMQCVFKVSSMLDKNGTEIDTEKSAYIPKGSTLKLYCEGL